MKISLDSNQLFIYQATYRSLILHSQNPCSTTRSKKKRISWPEIEEILQKIIEPIRLWMSGHIFALKGEPRPSVATLKLGLAVDRAAKGTYTKVQKWIAGKHSQIKNNPQIETRCDINLVLPSTRLGVRVEVSSTSLQQCSSCSQLPCSQFLTHAPTTCWPAVSSCILFPWKADQRTQKGSEGATSCRNMTYVPQSATRSSLSSLKGWGEALQYLHIFSKYLLWKRSIALCIALCIPATCLAWHSRRQHDANSSSVSALPHDLRHSPPKPWQQPSLHKQPTKHIMSHCSDSWLCSMLFFFLEFSSMLSNGTQSGQLPPGRNITLGYCILQVRISQKQRPKEGTNFYPVFSNIDFWWFVAISHYEYLWMLWVKQIHSATRSLFLFNDLLIVTGVWICISRKNIWSTLGTRFFLEISRSRHNPTGRLKTTWKKTEDITI